MKTPYFIEKIDWSELRNQKKLLLETINNDYVSPKHKEALEGILALIDAAQDYAVDEIGLNSNDVFDFELEEGRDSETPEEKFAREQAENIFQMHIEGSFLYENDVMSEGFIKSIIDDERHATAIKTIIRNAILADFEKGLNNNLQYDVEMYEYGYKIENYCLEQFYKDKTKDVWICDNCGSDNVQVKSWVSLNTNVIIDSASASDGETDDETDDFWCEDCEGHHKTTLHTIPFLKQVVGFQVVGNDGKLHPKIIKSHIYNLSQARKMINDNCSWELVTIWNGDIENPVMMFKGNPRT